MPVPVAALLLALVLGASLPGPSLAQRAAQERSCSSILESAMYRTFYDQRNPGGYARFEQAACSLRSNPDTNELILPLNYTGQTIFQEVARRLMRPGSFSPAIMNATDFTSSIAYKVVRDYYTAACRVRTCLMGLWGV